MSDFVACWLHCSVCLQLCVGVTLPMLKLHSSYLDWRAKFTLPAPSCPRSVLEQHRGVTAPSQTQCWPCRLAQQHARLGRQWVTQSAPQQPARQAQQQQHHRSATHACSR
jgi:hypothetical protein